MEDTLKLSEFTETKARIEGIVNIPIPDLIWNFRWQNIHYFIIRELGKWCFYFFYKYVKVLWILKVQLTHKIISELNGKYFFPRLQLPGHENANNKCVHIKYGQIIAEDCHSSGYCICKKTMYLD